MLYFAEGFGWTRGSLHSLLDKELQAEMRLVLAAYLASRISKQAGLIRFVGEKSFKMDKDLKALALRPPDPTVIWVNEDFVQPAMGRPAEEQCFGCQCMAAIPGLWLANGTFSKEYTCEEATLQNLIPEFHWGGPKDGQKCRSCQAFALTIEACRAVRSRLSSSQPPQAFQDLDHPNGMGAQEGGEEEAAEQDPVEETAWHVYGESRCWLCMAVPIIPCKELS
eukprot:Skav235181  [mRNA]  locus=scaffold721:323447:337677:- [translate_table: standard]